MDKRKTKAEKAGTKRAETVRHSAASALTVQTSTQAPASDRPPYQQLAARSELNHAWDSLLRRCSPVESAPRGGGAVHLDQIDLEVEHLC